MSVPGDKPGGAGQIHGSQILPVCRQNRRLARGVERRSCGRCQDRQMAVGTSRRCCPEAVARQRQRAMVLSRTPAACGNCCGLSLQQWRSKSDTQQHEHQTGEHTAHNDEIVLHHIDL
jgi:hypothetical protein